MSVASGSAAFDAIAGVTIVPLVAFLVLAFVRHPGPVLVAWVRTVYAVVVLAALDAAVLMPATGRPMYLGTFAAGLNFGVESNEIFTCFAVYLFTILDARFLEIAAARPANHALALVSAAFLFMLGTWTLVRHRGDMIAAYAAPAAAREWLRGPGFAGTVFNACVLVLLAAADLVPLDAPAPPAGTDPVMLVAAFVLGRNADAHRGVWTLASVLLLLAACVTIGIRAPLGLAPLLPLLVGSAAFGVWEHQSVTGEEVVVAVGAVLGAAVAAAVAYAAAAAPSASVVAVSVAAALLYVAVALATAFVLYERNHPGAGGAKRDS